jgi:hypothetical protein
MKLHMVVTLPSLHPSALQSLPSTYLNCHEQISSFPSDRIILPQSFYGRRYLPVHDICHIQGPLVCKLLPAMHALTGCDTTSSFFGIGKKTVLKNLYAKKENSCIWRLDNYTTFYIHVTKASISMNGV